MVDKLSTMSIADVESSYQQVEDPCAHIGLRRAVNSPMSCLSKKKTRLSAV
jgi:hypothetical protein